ncbi:NAD(P)-binding protein [Acrodontium crateriforme]|uniref:NAD(P)-binding protein n=1 Tax=Acrodontium crateriforme TaxID=150365 RepID=A0AAQ3R6F1_9PEZI|nr:NAD(P)-binding protein [Acrodontium crateriforme]
MSIAKTIVVTGANRGIGAAICKLLLSRPADQPLKLIAATRSGDDLGLAQTCDGHRVIYRKLDISNHKSVADFAETVESDNVDVLINNAGVNLDADYNLRNARRTLEVNYWGTLDLCHNIIPLLPQQGGRIVSLSSVASSLKPYSETIQARFRNPNASLADLDALANDYLAAVEQNSEEKSGFFHPGRSYNISKSLLNSATRILAAENPGLLINSCCPGWIRTDMGALVGSGKVQPPKTPEQGAKIPIRLALGDIGGVTGRYWANDTVRSRDEGKVQEW